MNLPDSKRFDHWCPVESEESFIPWISIDSFTLRGFNGNFFCRIGVKRIAKCQTLLKLQRKERHWSNLKRPALKLEVSNIWAFAFALPWRSWIKLHFLSIFEWTRRMCSMQVEARTKYPSITLLLTIWQAFAKKILVFFTPMCKHKIRRLFKLDRRKFKSLKGAKTTL